MEYGDLVHIIWDFQQLEAGSRESARDSLSEWLEMMETGDSPMEDYMKRRALQYLADYIDDNADDAADFLNQYEVPQNMT